MIKEISLTNFRGHGGVFKFGPGVNYIKGKNESGKSSIKEAIAFLWMGTDSEGSKNPDHLISLGSEETLVSLQTEKSVIKRLKGRGKTSHIKVCPHGLPEIRLTQTDLMKQVNLSLEVFMSSWCVGYFMNLKADQKLKVLGEISRVDRRQLLESLLPENTIIPFQVKLINPRIDAEAIAGLRRQEQNKKQASEIHLANMQKVYVNGNAVQIDIDSHKKRIANLSVELNEIDLIERLSAKHYEHLKKVRQIEMDLNSAEKQADMLQKIALNETQPALHAQVKELSKTIEDIDAEMESLNSQRKQVTLTVPKKPSLASEGVCPTCCQQVKKEHYHGLMEHYNNELMAYNNHERFIASHNQSIDEAVDKLLKNKRLLETARHNSIEEINKINRKNMKHREETAEIQGRINALRQLKAETEKLAPPPFPEVPKADKKQLIAERDKLTGELHTATTFSSQQEMMDAQILSEREAIVKYDSEIKRYALIEEALGKLPALETEVTLNKVNIAGVRMSLVDGDFIVTDEIGVDYRCLSDGRRIKIDLALCMAIKKAAGPTAPPWVFVDNSDLVDEIKLPENVQILIAEVADNKEVEVMKF